MFTGIVKSIGTIKRLTRAGSTYRLDVESMDFETANIGESVSINGACLTLVEKKKGVLSFDIMEETVRKSNLADLKTGGRVNMEDSLRAGASLGGHFVLGHIDCVGRVKNIRRAGGEIIFQIEVPKEFDRLLVEKGSIALDGVSLTVTDVLDGLFSIYLIPHTLDTTTLGSKSIGSKINVEFDVLGKYISKLNTGHRGRGVTENFLKEKGFF